MSQRIRILKREHPENRPFFIPYMSNIKLIPLPMVEGYPVLTSQRADGIYQNRKRCRDTFYASIKIEPVEEKVSPEVMTWISMDFCPIIASKKQRVNTSELPISSGSVFTASDRDKLWDFIDLTTS
jgi:hypothetical protein